MAFFKVGHSLVMLESFDLIYSEILSENQDDCENKKVTRVRSDKVSLLSLGRSGLSQRHKSQESLKNHLNKKNKK